MTFVVQSPALGTKAVAHRRISRSGTPVMFLSALEDVKNKAQGFEVGGNYYLTKPFEVLEVKARVRSLSNPLALSVGALSLATCALIAAVIPARRAASISPIRALRAE